MNRLPRDLAKSSIRLTRQPFYFSMILDHRDVDRFVEEAQRLIAVLSHLTYRELSLDAETLESKRSATS